VKKFLLLVIFFGFVTGGFAQSYYNRLQEQLQQAFNDTGRVLALIALANYHEYVRPDSNIYYVRQAVDLSDKIDFDRGRLFANVSLFFAANLRANYARAQDIAQNNLKIASAFKKDPLYYRSLIEQQLCLVSLEMGDRKNALVHSQEAFALQKQSGVLNAEFWGNYWLRGINFYAAQPDSALYYCYNAYIMAKGPSFSARYKSLATAGLANLQQKNGNYMLARQYYSEALSQCEEYNNVYIQARVYRDLAGLFRLEGNPDSCIYFSHRGLDICSEYNFGDYASRIAQILSGLYESQHKLDSAVKYMKLNMAARDSIFSQSNMQQFEYLIFQDQQKQQQAMLAKERLLRNIGTIFLAAILVLSILTLLNIRLKRRNERLENQNLLTELEHKTSEMEMQALRAQMNPHFIFNCLNSINMFIVKNESQAASDYLTQFSRLIRLVLNNSKKAWITLDEELEMLRLYLDMEKLRFKEAFDYKLDREAIADVFNVFIPPLLLQPFIENAIWHGLMHKKKYGTVIVRFREEKDILYCTIVDDGIGRSAAASLGSKSSLTHKSLGIKITTDRLRLINGNIDNDIVSFEIEDLYNEQKEVAGTKVSLKIKFQ
jgi:hypothetical protein